MCRADVKAPLRHVHALGANESLLLMPAWSAQDGAIGVKLVTVFASNGGNASRSRTSGHSTPGTTETIDRHRR